MGAFKPMGFIFRDRLLSLTDIIIFVFSSTNVY